MWEAWAIFNAFGCRAPRGLFPSRKTDFHLVRCTGPGRATHSAAIDHKDTETSVSKRIGWIGLGRMGEAMVKRLTKAGHTVEVWNRTRSKAEPLAEYGAVVVSSKQDLSTCDTVFTMVSTTNDLKEVLFGEGGLVAGDKRPRVVIDSSSISQEGSAEIRTKLEALGIAYLCAPVSGNAKVAKAGKLLVVASGPRNIYDEAEPYLAAMSRKAMWVGEGELARVWKIAHNTMFGVIIQNLCEITVLAEKAGITRDVFLESINDSVLGSMYTRYKTPVLTKLNFDQVTFTPKLLLKDMDLGLGAAKAHGVAMPAAAATRESIARMVGRGYEDIDFAVLLRETAADAGLQIQPLDVDVSDGLSS
ncbi:6-phosphogluconate dehydrogenase [Hydrogenophaga sp. IBVHS1]|nr:6-phosphogluconate dehydrogenase [Hydrogenophaga sp. IBVHS1]